MTWVVHKEREAYAVYVGRPSPWGNPYSHKVGTAADFKVATREEAIAKHREWFLSQPALIERAKRELRGKVLGCWCAPKACHGDVLAEVANNGEGRDATPLAVHAGTKVVCLDTEYDARYSDLGVGRLACMTYSYGPDHAAIAGPCEAVDLWLGWAADPCVTFLGHSLYNDFAVLAQEAYRRREGHDCTPGEGWAWELAHRLYDPIFHPRFPGDELRARLRVIDTEINQRLTQVRFGPHKASVALGDLAKMLFDEDRSDSKVVPPEAQALLRAAVPYAEWPTEVLARTPYRVLFGWLREQSEDPAQWPAAAVDYALDDARLPWRVLDWQHRRWSYTPGKPLRIPDDVRQTVASWCLHVLSIPGWKVDRSRAETIREKYRAVVAHCDRTLIDAGILHVPGAVETAKRGRLQALLYDAFDGAPPVTKTRRDADLSDEADKRDATATDAKTVKAALVKLGAQVPVLTDVLHRDGGVVAALADSPAPARPLVAHLLRTEAKSAALKLLKAEGVAPDQAALAPPEHAQLLAVGDACLPVLTEAGLVEVSYPRTIRKREVAERVFAILGDAAPLSKKKAEEFPTPTIEQRREFCSTDSRTVRECIITTGGKLRLPADAVAMAEEGDAAFDGWLAESKQPVLNGYAVRSKADKIINNFLDNLVTDCRVRTTYQTLVDTGRTACLAGWVQVDTKRGPVPIAEVVPGDYVWTHRGRWRQVTHVWTKGIQPMLNLHLASGKVVTCTASHRLLLSSGAWVRAGDLDDDTFNEVGKRSGEPGEGLDPLPLAQDPARGRHRQATKYDRVQRLLRHAQLYTFGRAQGVESDPAVGVQDGQEEPDAREERRGTPQLGGRVRERFWLPDLLTQRQTPVRAPRGDGESLGPARVAAKTLRASYRREQKEQQPGQPGASDYTRASHRPQVADAGHEVVGVAKVDACGDFEVYDITVDEDESYAACGVFHHNSRKINVQQLPRDYDKPAHLHVRGCLVPDPGWAFLVADYSQLELCALAHVLNKLVRHYAGTRQRGFVEDMLGCDISDTYESTLAQAINADQDCHVRMAATLRDRGEMYEECNAIYTWADAKKSKAHYAALGVAPGVSLAEIEDAVARLVQAAEPSDAVSKAIRVLCDAAERERYDAPLHSEEKQVIDDRQLAKPCNFGFPGLLGAGAFVGYAAGYGVTIDLSTAKRAKRSYLAAWIEMKLYFWHVSQMCNYEGVALVTQLYSKRQRGDCFPTQVANGFFQGLAADGAKEALRRIIRSAYRTPASPLFGTRPSGFIHDEFLVNCRVEQAPTALPALEYEMVAGMQLWIPDVQIKAPGKVLYERWGK